MPTVLALMAHPDDIEILCAGTLLLLRAKGWDVHLATMTAGDLGSRDLPPQKIARVRRAEAAAAAKLLGAKYTCLGERDLCITYNIPSKRRVSALIRRTRPDLLMTHSPTDYMADHEETSRLAREGAFAAAIPNWRCGARASEKTPLAALPAILYADPIDAVDILGRRQPAAIYVDITSVIDRKSELLACHASQRDWLRAQHGVDEYLLWMRRCGAARAQDARLPAKHFAEGFNPHHGHGFPAENILSGALNGVTLSAPRELSEIRK
jgi:LmbE family N-acetylglucosaminyl deacetylase